MLRLRRRSSVHLDFHFDEQDYLQFQLEVLEIIENINKRRKKMSVLPPPFTQYTPFLPYDQFHAYSHPLKAKSSLMSCYPTPQNCPPSSTSPLFSRPREVFNNPKVFSAQQLQTP